MHMHKKKIISLLLISCMLFNNTFSIFAENEIVQDINIDGNQETVLEPNKKEELSNLSDNQDKVSENKEESSKVEEALKVEEHIKKEESSKDNDLVNKDDNSKKEEPLNHEKADKNMQKDNKQVQSLEVQPPLASQNDSSVINVEDKLQAVQELLDSKLTDVIKSEPLLSGKIEIEGIQLGTAGDTLEKAETIDIRLFNKSADTLYSITRQIYKVIIDDLEVPMRDEEDNAPTFVLWNTNLYSLFSKSYNGKKAIEDFKKRDNHKVVIQFLDGSIAEYADEGYVTPEDRESINPNQPEVPKDGIAKEYEIKNVEVVVSWGTKEFQVEFNKDITNQHVNEIKAVKVNGTLFDPKPSDMRLHWSGKLICVDNEFVKKAQEKSPIELDIIFKDGSVLKNYTTPSIENPNGPRVVKAYILTKDKSKTSLLDKAIVRDVNVNPTDRMVGISEAHEVIVQFNKLNINGVDANISKITWIPPMGSVRDAKKLDGQENKFAFDIPRFAVWPKTSKKDTDLDIIIGLDKDIPNYKNTEVIIKLDWNGDFTAPDFESESPSQPEIKIASKYQVSDMLFETKKFVIKLDKEISQEDFEQIENIKINTNSFEKSVFSKNQSTIYTENESVLAKIKENPSVNLEINFKDKSKLTKTKQITLPNSNIASEYEIKEAKIEKAETTFSKDKFIINFNKKMEQKHISEIESVKINGSVFEKNKYEFFGNFGGGIQSENQEVVEKVKSSEKLEIEIKFKDGSILRFPKSDPLPNTNIASEYEIKEAKIEKGYLRDKFLIIFKNDKKIENNHVSEIESIKINGTVFEKDKYEFFKSFEGGIQSENKEVVEKVKSSEKLEIEIKFKDGSILKYSNSDTKPKPPVVEPPKTGIAANYDIIDVVTENYEDVNGNKKEVLKVTFDKTVQSLHYNYIKNINVNGHEFAWSSSKALWQKNDTLFRISNSEIVAKAKEKTPIEISLTFADNSKLTENIAYEPKELTLTSPLKDGLYTLKFKAYVKNTQQKELSTLNDYFDVKVKLEVKDGAKSISLLNHAFADLILDLAIKEDDKFKSFTNNPLKKSTNGALKQVEYTVQINDLSGVKDVVVLGSGPMGGDAGDIGKYDSKNYKKIDLVFDNIVSEGWTNYKIIEDEEKKKEKNDENLIQGLIANGLDTNKDGEISKEELKNAKGVNKKSSIQIDGFPASNVLDLERLELTDISMLKDLGPGIKAINLDGNDIESLPADVFENATGVTHILFGGNEIKSIDKDTFKKLDKLYFIDFDGNPLGTLPQGIFDSNPKLDSLSLMNTALTSIPDDLIKKNTRLQYLYLLDNKLRTLPDDFFSENIYLREVLLFNNNLENIPSSLGVNKNFLTRVEAQNNRITKIPDTFTNLKAIKKLDFSNNRISEIPDELFTNIIKLSKHASIKLDLTSNNLTYLPIDKMIDALSTGSKINNIEVNLNNLSTELSDDEKAKLEKIGIYFGENSGQDSYYPQKGSIKAKAKAENGKINLEQKFDILELYYWDLGDSTYYGGKNIFESEKEFYDYLIGEGRDNNKVSRNLERDEAIKEILKNKKLKWKVNTVITKNDSTVTYKSENENQKEGQNQEFSDSTMSKGDKYKLTKILYLYHRDWIPVIEYSLNFTAGNIEPKDEVEEINVKLNKADKDEKSMAGSTLKPTAHLVKKDGKFKYTVFFKPLKLGEAVGEISKLFISKNGQEVEITAKEESGDYPKSYTFELDEKVDKLRVLFVIPIMGEKKNPADLVFSYNKELPKPQPQPQQDTVKGHILTSDSTQISMADKSLDRDIVFKKIDKKAGPFNLVEFTIKFNEMKIGEVTGGVESLAVKLKDTWMDAKPVDGKKGVFTFEMLESAVKPKGSEKDTILNIRFGTYPKLPGHEMQKEAKLLLDWNGDFNGIVPNPPTPQPPTPPINPNPDTKNVYDVNVSLNVADKNEKSIANKALVDIARVEKIGENYKYTIEFKPMVVFGQKGNITKFAILNNGQKQSLDAVQENENKRYTFVLDHKVRKLRVYVHADIMEQLDMSEQEADLIFDWSNVSIDSEKETLNPKVNISDNVVIAQIDETVANEKIESLKDNGVLELDIKSQDTQINEKIEKLEIKTNLSKNILNKISDKGNKSVEVKTSVSSMKLNKNVLSQLSKVGRDIQISLKRVETTVSPNLQGESKEKVQGRPIVEVKIKDEDGKEISQFDDEIELSISYIRKENEEISKIKAYYIKDDNTMEVLKDSYYDDNKKAVVFKTKHFSKYAVGYDNISSNSGGTNSGGSNGGGSSGGGNSGGTAKEEMQDGTHYVNVWLKQTNSNDASMANKALSKQAKVVKNGNTYTYTLKFNPIEILSKTGNITKFSIDKNGSKIEISGSDGEYTFELNEKVNELHVYFEADIMKQLGMGEKDAVVVFDWNGSNPAPSESAKIESELKVKAIKIDTKEESIINKALNPKAKLVEENGKYEYTVEFKKINLEGKTAEIESFGIELNNYETKIITPVSISDSEYTKSYSFILDEEKDKVKVSFKISGIETKEKEAYLVFDKDTKKEKDAKKDAKSLDKLKEKAEKILSKEQSKYYKKETLKSIEKALNSHIKGDKKAKQQLENLLESARIEKIMYILKDGYMVGYPDNKFMPNNNITIAEASVMFNQLIDEEVGKIEKPTITTKSWYSDAVNKLVELGYIKVEKDKKLDPQRPITRAQYAYIVAKLRNYPPTDQNLKDIDKDYWAAKEISSLVGKGIINGYKDKTFKPDNKITRAEAVTIINKAFPINNEIKKKNVFSDVSEKHWAYKAIMLSVKN